MTATLAAVLREKGLLPSEVTVAQALTSDSLLRQLSAESGFAHVTLDQLLTHRGGAWEERDPEVWSYAWQLALASEAASYREQRRLYIARLLGRIEPREIGEFEYSNDGFSLASVMIETLLDVPWEDLMRRELFLPLRMSSAGFGAPPEIWGTKGDGEAVEVMDPRKPGADNPWAIAAAGGVHCSLEDAGRYMAVHLSAQRAAVLGLSPESWRRLHQVPTVGVPGSAGYAQGWIVRSGADGGDSYSLEHDGSNTWNYMRMKLLPSQGLAVVVTLNTGISAAQIAGELSEQVLEMTFESDEPWAMDYDIEFTGHH